MRVRVTITGEDDSPLQSPVDVTIVPAVGGPSEERVSFAEDHSLVTS